MTGKSGSRAGRERGGGAHAQGPSQRQLRVAEEVRHALAALFERRDFRDPDLAGAHVTVTEVRASPDLRHMTAFVSGLGRDLPPEQFAALRRATPFLRAQVAKTVRLKFAPDLHFQPDTALDYAMRMDALMKQPAVQRDLQPEAGDADKETPA
jgi:ribosome-binding factor A